MTEDRKAELAKLCAVQIRQASVLMKSSMADYGYHFVESVFDGEFWNMIPRLADKPVTDADMPQLRELIMEDLWPRLREQHRDLRVFLFGKLHTKYPGVFAEGADFAFDTGWRPLLQAAAERLQTYPTAWNVRIVGGKEKLGCCVVHIDCDYSARGCRSEVERLREEIRLRSLGMCEICGSSGRLRLSSYAKTVCDKHASVMGEMREDDGCWADSWKWNDDRPSCDEYPPEAAEVLRGMDPVRPRPKDHVVDDTSEFFPSPIRATDIGIRVDDDTWSREGREQELLIEFGFQIIDAVNGACVKEEYLNAYVRDEVAAWREYAVTPLSESDEEFLRGYVRGLIDEEYERVRRQQATERNND